MNDGKKITCDEAFEVLTRGPFPQGNSHDSLVEQHLANCHECRRFSEALRPAIHLIHESLSCAGFNELPQYNGYRDAPWLSTVHDDDWPTRISSLSVMQERGESSSINPSTTNHGLGLFATWVAVALLGLLFFGCLEVIQQNKRDDRVPQMSWSQLTPVDNGLPSSAGRQLLANLNLPNDCMSELTMNGLPRRENSVEQMLLLCCKNCHQGELTPKNANEFDLLMGTCSLCHAPSVIVSYDSARSAGP